MTRTTRTLHKWLGIGTGVVFLAWLVSGIVMETSVGVRGPWAGPYGTADWSAVVVSPAEAVRVATEDGGTSVEGVEIRRVGDRFVYRITAGGESRLVDGTTGEPVTIDREAALALARTEFGAEAEVEEVRRLEEREPSYTFGPLPAWRIDWSDGRGSVSYVAVIDGSVRRADHVTRTRAAVESLHTFTFLDAFRVGGSRLPLLIGASLVSIVTVATGYLLTVLLSAWYRRRRARGGGPGGDEARGTA